MATSYFMRWVGDQAQERKCELVLLLAQLDASKRQVVMEDFDRAMAVIYYELKLKLAGWQTLPASALAV